MGKESLEQEFEEIEKAVATDPDSADGDGLGEGEDALTQTGLDTGL